MDALSFYPRSGGLLQTARKFSSISTAVQEMEMERMGQPNTPGCAREYARVYARENAHENAHENARENAREYASENAHENARGDLYNWAIVATIFCFWSTGLCAVLKANAAREAVERGDMATARSDADTARLFVQISFAVGITLIAIPVLVIIILLL